MFYRLLTMNKVFYTHMQEKTIRVKIKIGTYIVNIIVAVTQTTIHEK